MLARHAKARDGVAFEVELDQDHRLPADDPAVVSRIDGHDLRRLELDHAAVGVFDVNLPARQEADMRVHATLGADNRLHRFRPAETGRIDHALDARRSGGRDVELHPADLARGRALDRRQQCVRQRSVSPSFARPVCEPAFRVVFRAFAFFAFFAFFAMRELVARITD